MVETLEIPTVGRHLADSAAALDQQRPERLGIVRSAGKTAANTYDRYRFNAPSRLAHDQALATPRRQLDIRPGEASVLSVLVGPVK